MKKERDVYLHDISLDEAWERFTAVLAEKGLWQPLGGEKVALTEALGRVTAEPVWARWSTPHYHASAMDGFAVRATDTAGATETRPLQLLVALNDDDVLAGVAKKPAKPVNTGHPLPEWADAVIMVEDVQLLQDDGRPTSDLEAATALEIRTSAAPWQHVRPMGEDMVATELVLPANHLLRPVDLGAIAGSGHVNVLVRRRPRVAVIPTGTELVSLTDSPEAEAPKAGQIIEYNSLMLAAQVETWGAEATRLPIVADSFERIRDAVRSAAETHDLVLVNAGSSAGTEDYTASVVADLGLLLVHGIAVRPGHPVILGLVGSTPVIGVPGYPVSTALTAEIIVEPLLSHWLGRPAAKPLQVEAVMTRPVHSPMGDDEFLRVTVGQVGSRVVATPLGRGAGTISVLVRSDGLVKIPRFSEGVEAGAKVTVSLYRTPDQIERTVVAIGSHDLTLDLLAQFLADRVPGARLSSANVGSLGGLIALRRGEAHFGGSHLLDPETGDYNWSYIQRYLPDTPVVLVTLVEREQGFIVAPGNPKGIRGWGDLGREDLCFANRQRGAGTRILLDYMLSLRGTDPASIVGYQREEFTHLAIAAAVVSGSADYGLGINAAANALGLDFVPLARERYDLVIPETYYQSDLLKPVLELLHEPTFRQAVAAMPGYHIELMGTLPEPPAI